MSTRISFIYTDEDGDQIEVRGSTDGAIVEIGDGEVYLPADQIEDLALALTPKES